MCTILFTLNLRKFIEPIRGKICKKIFCVMGPSYPLQSVHNLFPVGLMETAGLLYTYQFL
jgi:hypothetical protein